MGNAEFLRENYSVEQIEKIEIRGSGENYNELVSKLENIDSYEFVESDDPSTYRKGVSMDVITTGLEVLLTEKDLEKLDIEEFLKD